MDTSPTTTPAVIGYTSNAINRRIAVYIAIAALSTLAGSITDLASMTDVQVSAMTGFRWTVKLVLMVMASLIAGLNAYRAAIDRSTGSTATDKEAQDANPDDPSLTSRH